MQRMKLFFHCFLMASLTFTTIPHNIGSQARGINPEKALRTPRVDLQDLPPWNELNLRWGTYRAFEYGGISNNEPELVGAAFLWHSPDDPQNIIREHYEYGNIDYHWIIHDPRSSIARLVVNDRNTGFNFFFTYARYDNSSMVYHVEIHRQNRSFQRLSTFPYVFTGGTLRGNCEIYYNAENQCIIVRKPSGFFIMSTPNATRYQVGSSGKEEWIGRHLRSDITNDGYLINDPCGVADRRNNYGVAQYVFNFQEAKTHQFTIAMTEIDDLEEGIKKINILLEKAHTIIEIRREEFLSRFNFLPQGGEKELVIHAVSELFGNLAYFYGNETFVYDEPRASELGKTTDIRTAELFTIVPTKRGFPRGFLWDDMFHQLLVMRLDAELTKEILCSWLHFMDNDGWIYREITIGKKADDLCPDWAQLCKWPTCNPPIIFYTAWRFYKIYRDDGFLREIYPLLKTHYQFFLDTHDEDGDRMFNWVGGGLESGMDNFPRPYYPGVTGESVDMTAWMYMATMKMSKMAEALEFDFGKSYYNGEAQQIYERLQGFWNDHLRFFADLVYQLLPCDTVGYPGLLPFVFKACTHEEADDILKHLMDPSELWTSGGIRSLSKKDPNYIPHYWAGDVWMNINYLIVAGLEEWGYHQLAETLRRNIVNNMLSEFTCTGFIWEVYDGNSLKGKYNHCFAGWSALVTLLIIDFSDADNDGLVDYLENIFGTDLDNSDTDGDGLNDGEEVFTFGTNPLEADSDGDSWIDSQDLFPMNAALPNGIIIAVVVTIGTMGFLLYRRKKNLQLRTHTYIIGMN